MLTDGTRIRVVEGPEKYTDRKGSQDIGREGVVVEGGCRWAPNLYVVHLDGDPDDYYLGMLAELIEEIE